MFRTSRTQIAADTLSILDAGGYTLPSGWVSVAEAQARSLAGTTLYTPDEVRRLTRAHLPSPRHRTRVSVTSESTLECCARLAGAPGLAALNFASAKNPGGGFLGGAQAQEESLARSSGLYPTLLRCPDYYEANRRSGTLLYTDHLIRSPDVPVFRHDDGSLRSEPYTVTFLTSPAPNAGEASRRGEGPGVLPTLVRRAEQVLAVASDAGDRTLVLGAWGCGVFRNDPDQVARVFADLLGGAYAGAFEEVVFAILGRRDDRIREAFQQHLAPLVAG